MENYKRQRLVDYLNENCDSVYLRCLVLKYYDKLAQQNLVLSLDRIENMYVGSGGEMMEIVPDVTMEFSKDNITQIPLQDFLVFQLVNYIDCIVFKNDCKFSGYVDLTKNKIFVKRASRANLKSLVENNPKFKQFEVNEVVSNLLNENYRHILFHELTHLLEMKFYADGMIVNVGMENRCILRREDEILVADKNAGVNYYGEEYEDFDKIKNRGALLMSELFNELFTAQIAQWELSLQQTPPHIKEKYGLDRYLVYPIKYNSLVESEYLKLYRVFEFLTDFTECQFNFNDMRLNAASFAYVVNNILPQSAVADVIPVLQSRVQMSIPENAGLFDVICFNLGLVDYGVKNDKNSVIKAGMAFNEQVFSHINNVLLRESEVNKGKFSTKQKLTQSKCVDNVRGLEK